MQLHSKAGKILADAFSQYLLIQYAFNGCARQKMQYGVLSLYTHCSKAALQYGGLLLTKDEQGVLIWLRGKNFPLGLVRDAISGMWVIPFKLGIKPTLRLMQHDAEPDLYIKENAGPNMGYIWVIGVVKAAQGKGYSRWLVEKSIQQMKQQGMTEFWLKTEDPKNVSIYKRLGFEVVKEMVVKSSGLTSWVMKMNG